MSDENSVEISDKISGVVANSPASPHFEEYRDKYPARAPKLRTGEPADATQDKSRDPEIASITEAPTAAPTTGDGKDDSTKYLWLIGTEDVRFALENGRLGKSCGRGRLAHTNLFGAVPAHSGGELWFRDDTHIYLNGGSGRFPAGSSEELEACAESFRRAGYTVCSYGWNDDLDLPARVLLEGTEEWK